MIILSFDPGCHYSGYSLWKIPEIPLEKEMMLSTFGLIRSKVPKKLDWLFHARDISIRFHTLIRQTNPEVFLLEYPTFQPGIRGYSAARGGSILKLATLCGMLLMLWDMRAVAVRKLQKVQPPIMVKPYTWKGQIPKHVTRNRINADFGLQLKKGIEENISDAIGIGNWFITKQIKWEINTELGKERKDY